MAFDPQPITFQKYESTYADPKYGELATALNKRYETIYGANDALEAQLMQLESAPFEFDQAAKIKVIKDTQSKLAAYAERGDYENLSREMVGLSKQYAKDVSGITTNKKLYDAYVANLSEMVKNKEIDEGTKNKLIQYSSYGYKGAERDPQTGLVSQASLFKGAAAVRDPDVLKILDEHLAKIKADGDITKIKRVDQIQYDANGNPLPGRYEVLTDKGWEGVSEEDVLASFNTIIKKPEISAFLQQRVLLDTYDKTPEELANWAKTTAGSYEQSKQQLEEQKLKIESQAKDILNADPNALSAEQQQVVDAYNSINTQLSEYNRRLSQFGAAQDNPEVLRRMAQQGLYEDKVNEYRQYATNTYAYNKETADALEVGWDPAYLKTLDSATGDGKKGVISEVITEMPSIEVNPENGTYTATNDYIKKTEATVKALEAQLSDPNNPLSTQLRGEKEAQKRNLESNLAFEKEKLARAYKIAGVEDPESMDKVLADKQVDMGYNPVTKEKIYLNQSELVEVFRMNNFDIGKTAKWLKANKNLGIVEWNRTVDFTSPEASQFFQLLKQTANEAYKNNTSPEAAIYESLNAETLGKVQEILETNAKSAVTMTTLFPGTTKAERITNTKYIRDYFEKGIPNHVHAWLQDTEDPANSTISQLITDGKIGIDYEIDVNKISVNNESSNPGSSFGEDIIVIPVMNKDTRQYTNIFVPANDVYTPSMKQSLNEPSNRFSRIMARATTLPSLPGEQNYYNHNIISTAEDPELQGPWTFQINPSNNTVRVIHNGDKTEWYSPQDSEFKRLYLNKKGIGDKF